MTDRIDQLQETAERLGRELAELRLAIGELRHADGAAAPDEGGEGLAPAGTSRVDALNAAFRRPSAPPPAVTPGPMFPPGAPDLSAARPASSWDQVFRTLGMAPRGEVGGRTRPRVERRGFEELVGRYGTIALASLTILMGIGALIGWAMRNGYLGPAVRVALGLVLAAVLAVVGWRVRQGDSPRYGNALLALSMAIVHVVAWGAGPRLHLISIPAVLALAALASAALAALAWREDDQLLFNVGFGGALLAPYVTSDGGGSAVMLLSYGFVVLAAGIASLGQREWTRTPLVALAGLVVYAASGVSLVGSGATWAVRSAAGVFALGLGALAMVLLDGAKRMAITYPALLTAFGAMLAVAAGTAKNPAQYPFAVLLMLATRFAGDASRRGLRTSLVGAIVLPLGATALALGSLGDAGSAAGVATALLFAALAAAAAWQDVTHDRRTYAFTATLLAGLAVGLGADERQVLFCVLIAGFGLACAAATQRLRLGGIGLAGGVWLGIATGVAFSLLDRRTLYAYTPFLTSASFAAAAVALAWVFLSFHTARNMDPGSRFARGMILGTIRMIGGGVVFFWVRQEVARAVSADVSAFLVVAWYAIAGVASIFLGHARALPVLRQVGLGLSVLAALTTIAQASSLVIGWRVASYLLAGVFLLGVAYSYRLTRSVTAGSDEPLPAADR